MIDGPLSKEITPAHLLSTTSGDLIETQIAGLWEVFLAIHRTWGDGATNPLTYRSQWLEFVTVRTRQEPSYLEEYRSGLLVLAELLADPAGDPWARLFFDHGSKDLTNRLGHLRVFVVEEFIKVWLAAEIDAAVTGPMVWELQGFMEEFANPLNRIELGTGLNRLGLPQTRMRFARAEGFIDASAQRLLWMVNVIREMGLTVSNFGVQPQRGDRVASTCRMTRSPAEGVVDENLRVHGLDNLYICSNAVFPSGAAVNPTLTLTALTVSSEVAALLRLRCCLFANGRATPPRLERRRPGVALACGRVHVRDERPGPRPDGDSDSW